jgi:DNA-directed RNA polymerase specialized sigma24 family protein
MDPQAVRTKFDEHVRRGIFAPVARHLGHDAADRMQEGMALTWKLYREQADRGRELEPALLVHACRMRAQDLSRSLANDRSQKLRDAYDPRNQMAGRVALVDADAHGDGHGNAFGMAESACINPTSRLDSAIDLSDWLDTLSSGDRSLMELRAEGFTWQEAGAVMGMPLKTVYDRGHKLGMDLARRAGVPAPASACS